MHFALTYLYHVHTCMCRNGFKQLSHTSCCRCSLAEIKEKSSEAYQMLDTWKQSYLEMRKKIEQSGRDARWEFDRKKLFERSDHISNVCKDIYKIAQVLVTTSVTHVMEDIRIKL